MITDEQIANLKKGDKLIFSRNVGLSAKVGNVFTFSNWKECSWLKEWKPGLVRYFQCQELLDMGNEQHSFPIHDTELFNTDTHKKYKIMSADILNQDKIDFIKTWGGY